MGWNWKIFWAVLIVGLLLWFAPEAFVIAGDTANEVADPVMDTTVEVADETYVLGRDVVTEVVTGEAPPPPGYGGPLHLNEVRVTFDVNPAYHNWGQILASYHQLPEITGRVYAARIVRDSRGRAVIAEELPDAGLLSQVRLNWHTGTRMRWNNVRVRTPEYHLPIGARTGWHLCVDLHEATEGHNILGGIQDALHFVHWDDWHLSTGNVPVAGGECVELDNNSWAYDYNRQALTRPGETEPTGWLTVRFEGIGG